MNPDSKELRQLYEGLFDEELPPFESLRWPEPLDTNPTFNRLSQDPRMLDFPEGYPVGHPEPQTPPPAPSLQPSVGSSHGRSKRSTPTKVSNQRQFRRVKKRSTEQTFSLREQTKSNPFAISAQTYEDMLRPYGNIRDSDLVGLWSFPQQQDFACQFTVFIEGASYSGALMIPGVDINVIPVAVAQAMQPMGTFTCTSTYQFGSFVGQIGRQVSLQTTVGKASARLLYHVSSNIQNPILGAPSLSALSIAYCPRTWKIMSSSGDLIDCARIPIKTTSGQ